MRCGKNANRRAFRVLAAFVVLGAPPALLRGQTAALVHSAQTPAAKRPAAPPFSLEGLDGRTITLARYRGSVVLLNFWATWCAPCRAEIPRLVELQNRYSPRARVVGISLDDDPAPVRPFYEKFRMNYPVAIGDAGLAEKYGRILGLPVTFLIDCAGRIAARHDGELDASRVEREIAPLLREADCRNPASTDGKQAR